MDLTRTRRNSKLNTWYDSWWPWRLSKPAETWISEMYAPLTIKSNQANIHSRCKAQLLQSCTPVTKCGSMAKVPQRLIACRQWRKTVLHSQWILWSLRNRSHKQFCQPKTQLIPRDSYSWMTSSFMSGCDCLLWGIHCLSSCITIAAEGYAIPNLWIPISSKSQETRNWSDSLRESWVHPQNVEHMGICIVQPGWAWVQFCQLGQLLIQKNAAEVRRKWQNEIFPLKSLSYGCLAPEQTWIVSRNLTLRIKYSEDGCKWNFVIVIVASSFR